MVASERARELVEWLRTVRAMLRDALSGRGASMTLSGVTATGWNTVSCRLTLISGASGEEVLRLTTLERELEIKAATVATRNSNSLPGFTGLRSTWKARLVHCKSDSSIGSVRLFTMCTTSVRFVGVSL